MSWKWKTPFTTSGIPGVHSVFDVRVTTFSGLLFAPVAAPGIDAVRAGSDEWSELLNVGSHASMAQSPAALPSEMDFWEADHPESDEKDIKSPKGRENSEVNDKTDPGKKPPSKSKQTGGPAKTAGSPQASDDFSIPELDLSPWRSSPNSSVPGQMQPGPVSTQEGPEDREERLQSPGVAEPKQQSRIERGPDGVDVIYIIGYHTNDHKKPNDDRLERGPLKGDVDSKDKDKIPTEVSSPSIVPPIEPGIEEFSVLDTVLLFVPLEALALKGLGLAGKAIGAGPLRTLFSKVGSEGAEYTQKLATKDEVIEYLGEFIGKEARTITPKGSGSHVSDKVIVSADNAKRIRVDFNRPGSYKPHLHFEKKNEAGNWIDHFGEANHRIYPKGGGNQ